MCRRTGSTASFEVLDYDAEKQTVTVEIELSEVKLLSITMTVTQKNLVSEIALAGFPYALLTTCPPTDIMITRTMRMAAAIRICCLKEYERICLSFILEGRGCYE